MGQMLVLTRLGVVAAMSCVGSGGGSGGSGAGSNGSTASAVPPTQNAPMGTGSHVPGSSSRDEAVLEAVLLHEIAAAKPGPDETLCVRVRGATSGDASAALLAALQRHHPRAGAASLCQGGGAEPVRLIAGGAAAVMFDVGPVKWDGANALVEGGGGTRGGAVTVREVEYRLEPSGSGYKVVSERVVRQI